MDAFSWSSFCWQADPAWGRKVSKNNILVENNSDSLGLSWCWWQFLRPVLIVKVLYRYCDSALFGGFEDIGSIKRVESDLSNPTVMVYESSKFLGENLNLEAMKKMAKCTKKIIVSTLMMTRTRGWSDSRNTLAKAWRPNYETGRLQGEGRATQQRGGGGVKFCKMRLVSGRAT